MASSHPDPNYKVHTVMSEYKRGTLKSSSGKRVTNRKQAIAIALSEQKRSVAERSVARKA
ncbi:MAG: DUF6496 domain-containing protein [Anaerolineae bacterium]|nr:DUF6496 domain-containing protein [Anaerolineae bacterium]